jgi:hypothetical protein
MVKIINIDTKTRTIRIDNADSDIKTWRTTESGTHFPIKKGESTKEALDKFVGKKRPEAKKKSGLLGDRSTPDEQLKTPKAREIYDRITRYAAEHNKDLQEDEMKHLRSLRDILLDDNNAAEHVEKNFQKWFGSSKQQPAKKEPELLGDRYDRTHGIKTEKSKEGLLSERKGPEDVDVSDIVKNYKKQMKALGSDAPIEKTDRVEADAIKEFMTRKIGANRPYEDYYQYWLNGMDKATKDAFNEIYNESEAREMAFSELASDVDHSGLARGEPTYDELMEWSKKQKAKKAEKKEPVDMWAKPKSHEGSESFKSAMQETMKSFPRLYDFEKQPLESFAEDIYGKLQENPGKEQAVLDHYVDAYKSYIATLGPWVDTPTLVKKAFLDKMVEQNLEERNQKRREESRWGNAGLGTAFYDLKK